MERLEVVGLSVDAIGDIETNTRRLEAQPVRGIRLENPTKVNEK